ncbi:hypothetical protein QFZ43_008630 [Streptomyces afghaniensis]|nr:hypothetical protein [Streptomyces afghaniensis]
MAERDKAVGLQAVGVQAVRVQEVGSQTRMLPSSRLAHA